MMGVNMNNYYAEYVEFLNKKNSSANTKESYLRDIQIFLRYIKSIDCNFNNVNEEIIASFIDQLKSNGKSNSTINRQISSIRGYYKFLISVGLMENNPAKSAKINKTDVKLPKILSKDEIDLLLAQPMITDPKGCRDKAMLELLYSTGIRVTELINLDINDVDLHTGVITLAGIKGVRKITLNTNAIVAISDYIFRTRSYLVEIQEQGALFVNLNGNRLTRQGFWKIIKNYSEKAGIKTELTPHTLRHSLALHLLQNGVDKNDLKIIMGYSDVASTQIYTKILEKNINT